MPVPFRGAALWKIASVIVEAYACSFVQFRSVYLRRSPQLPPWLRGGFLDAP
jgi:hypothetical protein